MALTVRSTIVSPSLSLASIAFRNLINRRDANNTLVTRFLGTIGGTIVMNNHTTISYVTTPSEEVARRLSEKLVANRLAACVNIVKGVESIYEWKNKIEHDNEMLLIIKSHSSKTKDLTEFVEKNHPYECPEVITLQVDSGSQPYLDWVHSTINKSPISSMDKETDDK